MTHVAKAAVVESKSGALYVVEAGVYVCDDHISIADRAHLAILAILPTLLAGMHYERSPWVSCFLKLSCVHYTASQLRAGRESALARLIDVVGAQVSCNS